MRTPFCSFCLTAIGVLASFGGEFEVAVQGGKSPTRFAVVTAPAPKAFPAAGWLRNDKGKIPFQKTGDNVVFVMAELGAGENRRFSVATGQVGASVVANTINDRVEILIADKPMFTYQGPQTELPRPGIKPTFQRGAYLHPILSPSGKQVSDDYPPNHLHHHGIWFPWTKAVFEGRNTDFWNMGEAKGRVDFVRLGWTWSGPVQAGLQAHHRFIDLTSGQSKTALDEVWSIAAYTTPDQNVYIFDLESTQTCATAASLELPKYHYGGLGFRGNWDWNGEGKCFVLTSNGETNRVKANETSANWCHIGGQVDGGLTGIAILCHPENFRAPQPIRIHPKEPFFCYAPSQSGDWSIEPGAPYVSKYRFIVQDGPPDKRRLDEVWEGYANPPKVAIRSL